MKGRKYLLRKRPFSQKIIETTKNPIIPNVLDELDELIRCQPFSTIPFLRLRLDREGWEG